jgi:hypothetical protein
MRQQPLLKQCSVGPDFVRLVRTLSGGRFQVEKPPHNYFIYETRFLVRSTINQEYKEWNKIIYQLESN